MLPPFCGGASRLRDPHLHGVPLHAPGIEHSAGAPIPAQQSVDLIREFLHIGVEGIRGLMVNGHHHLPAQIDHLLGIVLRLGVHHALVKQEIRLIVPPRLRLVQIVDPGGKADLVAIGQGQHEIRVEQAAVLIQRLRALDAKQLFREGIVVEADPCQRVVAPVVDI